MQFSVNNFLALAAVTIAIVSTAPVTSEVESPTLERRAMIGKGTYYDQNDGFGSCGQRFQDSDFIVALGPAHRNVGQLNCGKRIWARALDGPGRGNRIEATVRDTCPICEREDVDFSVGAFDALTNNQKGFGVIRVEWDFL
ncbi:RlpA-like double-psi beta-barrel-protein domain-containing protein-containing protein [Morchella snyderi]|nr:RlpA-like double-psi beta-barrel-protein domain-containing protein-containing protein [Morchella snyderi]